MTNAGTKTSEQILNWPGTVNNLSKDIACRIGAASKARRADDDVRPLDIRELEKSGGAPRRE
jgi:hypothetical protein